MSAKKKDTFTFEGQTYTLNKETKGQWTLAIPRSEVHLAKIEELNLLLAEAPQFMPVAFEYTDDEVTFTYTTNEEAIEASALKDYPLVDKLRAAMNFNYFTPLLGQCYTFSLHPQNMQFDYNLVPKLAYRGLTAGLPPAEVTEESFLRQYKCAVIALFSKKQTFESLYEGNLERASETGFIKEVAKKATLEELLAYLNKQYQTAKAKEEKVKIKVPKKRFLVFKYLSIFATIFAIGLAVPVVYTSVVSIPFKNTLLAADEAFLKADYAGVITTLKDVEVDQMDNAQKYILAYSYIKGSNLTDNQKNMIMTTKLSLKSQEDYLAFWIEDGRGNIEKALDLAIAMQDPDLILYGISQRIMQVQSDPKLSGAEKEELVDKYESDREKYKEKYPTTTESKEDAADAGTDSSAAVNEANQASDTAE